MLDDLFKRAREFDQEARLVGGTVWYRGLRDGTWDLTSSIHRHVEDVLEMLKVKVEPERKRQLMYDEAHATFRRFEREAASLLRSEERNPWGTLAAMQHFGIPSRLMDWSESLVCALFFAQRKRERGKDACIWALKPEGFNVATGVIARGGVVSLTDFDEKTTVQTRHWHPKFRPDKELLSLAAYPLYTNPRMVAQRSAFVVAGDSFDPLDKQFGGILVKERLLMRVDLPAAQFDEVEDYLRIAGVTAFTYFPDLEGIAERNKQQARWNVEDTAVMLKGK